jgi:hypothetical protein
MSAPNASARRFLSGLAGPGGTGRTPPAGLPRPVGVDGWPANLFSDARKHDGDRAERSGPVAHAEVLSAARRYLEGLGRD